MRRNTSIVVYTLGVILFLASCSSAMFYGYKVLNHEFTVEKEPARKHQYHFVLIPEELDNEYWRVVEEGAKAAADKYGVLLEYVGPKQANLAEHVKMLETAAATKVDGILTQGLNDERFNPLINRIVEKVPVLTIDTDAPNSKRISYIGTDNYYAGFLAGKALLADTNGAIRVAVITGSLYTNHQAQRVKGFMDAVSAEKRVQIVTVEESGISQVNAAEKAYQILQKHPEVNAFYGTSALDCIGVAEVVEKYNKQREMYIIGFDTLPETLDYIRRGIIEATVVQEPYEMGYRAVTTMIDLLQGKTAPPIIHTETRILRVDGLDRMEGKK